MLHDRWVSFYSVFFLFQPTFDVAQTTRRKGGPINLVYISIPAHAESLREVSNVVITSLASRGSRDPFQDTSYALPFKLCLNLEGRDQRIRFKELRIL
jgi:hypothetical protein